MTTISPLQYFRRQNTLTELYKACRNGQEEVVYGEIITNPGDINKTVKGHYPLHEAAEYNNVGAIRQLTAHNADLNALTDSLRTPLMLATAKGNEEAIKLLLDLGANPLLKDNHQKTARIVATNQLFSKNTIVERLLQGEFIYACTHNEVHVLRELLTEIGTNKDLINNALKVAAHNGNIETIEVLIDNGADMLNAVMECAVMQGHRRTASYLMLCSHCQILESNGIINFTKGVPYIEHGVDIGDLSVETCTELQYDSQFNLKIPIKLILEGQDKKLGTDVDAEDCIYHILLTRVVNEELHWSDLNLTYISDWWFNDLYDKIKELDISKNKLQELPSTLSRLVNLEQFVCYSNQLRELPRVLFELPRIQFINVSSNALQRIVPMLAVSSSLKSVNLSDNQLTELPNEFGTSAIQTLKLNNNLFEVFPHCVCYIDSLMQLEMENCKFTDIPNELGRLQDLQLVTLPKIQRLSTYQNNTDKLKRFLSEKLLTLKPLYEMKMIVVGREGRGKTTLVKRLSGDYEHSPNISTVGINISKVNLKLTKPITPNTVEKPTYTLRMMSQRVQHYTFHTWDFGGQEEYYATHQCFISPASLYLLVFGLDRGHDGVNELRQWLGNITARAPGSSVIIIGTHMDMIAEEYCLEILNSVSDKVQQWGLNVIIAGITAVSSDPHYKRSVINLADLIVTTAQTVKYQNRLVLGQPIPSSYLTLIERVNELKIEYENHHKVPVLQEAELWQLVKDTPGCQDIDSEMHFTKVTDLMHNMGVILHFKEPSLHNLYFLDPCWLCAMMSQIVTIKEKNPYIRDGILPEYRVRHVLTGKRFPDNMFSHYLRILNRFEIALKIDNDKILIPSLLPADKDQDLNIPELEECYERWFSFRNIPSGFVSRVLVCTLAYLDSISSELESSVNENSRVHTESGGSEKFGGTDVSLDDLDIGVEDIITEESDGSEPIESLTLSHMPQTNEIFDKLYLNVWQNGLSFNHPKLLLFILPVSIADNNEGIRFVVSKGSNGRRALCHLIDTLSTLMDDWYPGLLAFDGLEPKVKQLIPCPECTDNMFDYEECLAAVTDSNVIVCPQHADTPVQLCDLIPDIFLSDLDEEFIVKRADIDFEETAASRLGGGTFGSVYKGMFKGKPVAVKKFYSIPAQPEYSFLELRREVNILRKVSHVCIVKMVGVCLRPQCLLLEKALDQDLSEHIHGGAKLHRLLIYKILHQTSCALAYLHKNRIIYRDVKPSNVLIWSMDLMETPNIKLSDYGIAGVVSSAGVKGMQGTTGFQAPEILKYQGLEEYTEAVDVYSFAFLLFECICRKKAYSGMNRFDIKASVMNGERPDYKYVLMSRMGMHYLTQIMKECWDADHRKRPKMSRVAKRLTNPQFQLTMLIVGIHTRTCVSSCSVFAPISQKVWIAINDHETTSIITVFDCGSLTNFIQVEIPQIKTMVSYKDSVWILGANKFSTRLYKYHAVEQELEQVIEDGSIECIASIQNYLFIGYKGGLISRKSYDAYSETGSKMFRFQCKSDLKCILEQEKEVGEVASGMGSMISIADIQDDPLMKPNLEGIEEEALSLSVKLKNSIKKSFSRVSNGSSCMIIVLTRTHLYLCSSDFSSVFQYHFYVGNEDIIAVTYKTKVFAAGRGGSTIHTFSLKRRKKTRIIDLLDQQLQKRLDCPNIKCLSLEVTEDLLWVGTNVGAVLIFSTSSQSLISYIRPFVKDVTSILQYNPLENLCGTEPLLDNVFNHSSDSDEHRPDRSRKTHSLDGEPSVDYVRTDSNLFRNSTQPILKTQKRTSLLLKYNPNYVAGTFVLLCGIGSFTMPEHNLTDRVRELESRDVPHGAFAVIVEAPCKAVLTGLETMYSNGGLIR